MAFSREALQGFKPNEAFVQQLLHSLLLAGAPTKKESPTLKQTGTFQQTPPAVVQARRRPSR